MELSLLRRQIITALVDSVEALSGEELLTIVTRGDNGVLTPWVLFPDAELLGDQLNGWVDNTPWNAPKSL